MAVFTVDWSVRHCLALALCLVPAPATAQSWSQDSSAVSTALRTFLTAFENLEWERFRTAFSPTASVFHPAPDTPERYEGRSEVESSFRLVFDQLRASNPNGPPFHRLDPDSLRLESLGDRAVLVTFLLRNERRIARRTIIFRREGDTWLITHLHASNADRSGRRGA